MFTSARFCVARVSFYAGFCGFTEHASARLICRLQLLREMIIIKVCVFVFAFLLQASTVSPQEPDKQYTSSLPAVSCHGISACAQLYFKGIDLPRFNADGETSCDPDSVCGCDPWQLIEYAGICWQQSTSESVKAKLLEMQVTVYFQQAPLLSGPLTSTDIQCPSVSSTGLPFASLFTNPDLYVHPSLVLRHTSGPSAINTTMTNSAIVTTSKLAHGDVVMKIPKQALISKESLKDTPNGQFLLAMLSGQVILDALFSLFLLFEKGNPDSNWKDIICHLPASYSHSPKFWPLSAMKSHDLEKETVQRVKYALIFYNQAAPSIASRYGKNVPWSVFEFRSFMWAFSSIEASSIHVAGPDSLAVIPGLHQVKHALKPNLKLHLDSSNSSFYSVVVSKKKGIRAGDELTFSHGAHCNKYLLLKNGITIEGNSLKC